MDRLDYDDDDFYAPPRSDAGRGLAWSAAMLAVAALMALVWSCSGRAQDFQNVAGAQRVQVTQPVQIGGNVTFDVDPLQVLGAQSIDFLCAYVRILSSARSSPTSPAHVPGQRPMRCVENTEPPTSPGSTLPPPFVNGRVTYAAGVVTVAASPQFTKVELLVDSKIVSGYYYGTRTFVEGRATFALKPEILDGQEHLLDVRLYTDAMDRPHRPDNYPVRAVLAP